MSKGRTLRFGLNTAINPAICSSRADGGTVNLKPEAVSNTVMAGHSKARTSVNYSEWSRPGTARKRCAIPQTPAGTSISSSSETNLHQPRRRMDLCQEKERIQQRTVAVANHTRGERLAG